MVDALSDDERDARSLAIQEQMESKSRRIAWEQTYRRKRKRKTPMRGDSDEWAVPLVDAGAALGANPTASSVPTIDARTRFERISVSRSNDFPGVYGILLRGSDRIYIGSSINIIGRIRQHVSDLEGKRHHSAKLQNAFANNGLHQFEFVLVERVADVIDLRAREQHLIDQFGAYARGFNSRSQAEGPELSLATHIENAKRVHLPAIFARPAPERGDFTLNDLDRRGFSSELRLTLLRKFKQTAITGALIWVGVEFPSLRLLWLAIMLYFGPVILFDWPDTPRRRAERRYFDAEEGARKNADAHLIQFVADRLGVPQERVAEAYPLAEKTMSDRKERSERYRRRVITHPQ